MVQGNIESQFTGKDQFLSTRYFETSALTLITCVSKMSILISCEKGESYKESLQKFIEFSLSKKQEDFYLTTLNLIDRDH